MKIYQLAKKPDKQYHPHTTVCYDTHGSWAFLYSYYLLGFCLQKGKGAERESQTSFLQVVPMNKSSNVT